MLISSPTFAALRPTSCLAWTGNKAPKAPVCPIIFSENEVIIKAKKARVRKKERSSFSFAKRALSALVTSGAVSRA